MFVWKSASDMGVTGASTAVTNATGSLLIDPQVTLPANLLLASDGSVGAPEIVTQTASDIVVLPGDEMEYPIESITDATNLVLEAIFPGSTDANVGGMISSASWMLDQHYALVIRFVRHMVYDKLGNRAPAKEQFAYWEMGKKQFRYDVLGRAQDVEYVQDFDG